MFSCCVWTLSGCAHVVLPAVVHAVIAGVSRVVLLVIMTRVGSVYRAPHCRTRILPMLQPQLAHQHQFLPHRAADISQCHVHHAAWGHLSAANINPYGRQILFVVAVNGSTLAWELRLIVTVTTIHVTRYQQAIYDGPIRGVISS